LILRAQKDEPRLMSSTRRRKIMLPLGVISATGRRDRRALARACPARGTLPWPRMSVVIASRRGSYCKLGRVVDSRQFGHHAIPC
jgi:hypothetical protein